VRGHWIPTKWDLRPARARGNRGASWYSARALAGRDLISWFPVAARCALATGYLATAPLAQGARINSLSDKRNYLWL